MACINARELAVIRATQLHPLKHDEAVCSVAWSAGLQYLELLESRS
jgi:hypothetical protein